MNHAGASSAGPAQPEGENDRGAVVTKDIPANVVAAGNPARVIRELG